MHVFLEPKCLRLLRCCCWCCVFCCLSVPFAFGLPLLQSKGGQDTLCPDTGGGCTADLGEPPVQALVHPGRCETRVDKHPALEHHVQEHKTLGAQGMPHASRRVRYRTAQSTSSWRTAVGRRSPWLRVISRYFKNDCPADRKRPPLRQFVFELGHQVHCEHQQRACSSRCC